MVVSMCSGAERPQSADSDPLSVAVHEEIRILSCVQAFSTVRFSLISQPILEQAALLVDVLRAL